MKMCLNMNKFIVLAHHIEFRKFCVSNVWRMIFFCLNHHLVPLPLARSPGLLISVLVLLKYQQYNNIHEKMKMIPCK